MERFLPIPLARTLLQRSERCDICGVSKELIIRLCVAGIGNVLTVAFTTGRNDLPTTILAIGRRDRAALPSDGDETQPVCLHLTR
jgi:hypothetical protein